MAAVPKRERHWERENINERTIWIGYGVVGVWNYADGTARSGYIVLDTDHAHDSFHLLPPPKIPIDQTAERLPFFRHARDLRRCGPPAELVQLLNALGHKGVIVGEHVQVQHGDQERVVDGPLLDAAHARQLPNLRGGLQTRASNKIQKSNEDANELAHQKQMHTFPPGTDWRRVSQPGGWRRAPPRIAAVGPLFDPLARA